MSLAETQPIAQVPVMDIDGLPSVGDVLPIFMLPEDEGGSGVHEADDRLSGRRRRRRRPPAKRRATASDAEGGDDVTVLGAGFIVKAPLPIEQAARAEAAAGASEGEYFVELMRKRFQCMHDMQVRWIARTCNVKNPKYMETQVRLKDFTEIVLAAFATQFGPQSKAIANPRTRRHQPKTENKIQGRV
jgi:hypothetical protein